MPRSERNLPISIRLRGIGERCQTEPFARRLRQRVDTVPRHHWRDAETVGSTIIPLQSVMARTAATGFTMIPASSSVAHDFRQFAAQNLQVELLSHGKVEHAHAQTLTAFL